MKKLYFLAFCLLTITASPLFAENSPYYEVVKVKSSAWLTRDAGAKASLLENTLLKSGDEVELLQGNTLDLIFHNEAMNRLHVIGPAVFKMVTNHLEKNMQLSKGRAYAWIDHLPPGSSFKVTTPVAIVAVRGTKFQMNTSGDRTIVFNYDGTIEIYTRNLAGTPSKDFIPLRAGEKATIERNAKTPPVPQPMTSLEMQEIETVFLDEIKPEPTPKTEVRGIEYVEEKGLEVSSYEETASTSESNGV